MKPTLQNKTALVTGATGGLGREFVNELVYQGYNLIIVGRNMDTLTMLANSPILQQGQSITPIKCDTTKDNDVTSLFEYLRNQQIKLDMLVNVAGLEVEGWFKDTSHKDTVQITKINVVGTTNMIHHALECKAKELLIINVSSMAGFYPMPMKAVYSATKRYLIDLTKTLNYELKDEGVHLTVVCPAGMATRDDILAKIKSQGVFGSLTTININTVVRKSIQKTYRKKTVYVPGFLNQIIVLFSTILPSSFMTNSIGRRWKKTSSKIQK